MKWINIYKDDEGRFISNEDYDSYKQAHSERDGLSTFIETVGIVRESTPGEPCSPSNPNAEFLQMQFPGKGGSDIHSPDELKQHEELMHLIGDEKIEPKDKPDQPCSPLSAEEMKEPVLYYKFKDDLIDWVHLELRLDGYEHQQIIDKINALAQKRVSRTEAVIQTLEINLEAASSLLTQRDETIRELREEMDLRNDYYESKIELLNKLLSQQQSRD